MAELKRLQRPADLDAVDGRKIIEVPVPEWGFTVRLREMTADEAIKFNDTLSGLAAKNAMVRIVALCAIDDAGERVFTNEDLPKLAAKNLTALNRLQQEAMMLNGLKEPKKAEEDAKNA